MTQIFAWIAGSFSFSRFFASAIGNEICPTLLSQGFLVIFEIFLRFIDNLPQNVLSNFGKNSFYRFSNFPENADSFLVQQLNPVAEMALSYQTNLLTRL